MNPGRLHPITIAIRDIAAIFEKMGFGVGYGPELEDEFHNFDGLRMLPDHPARDMQDTFWAKEIHGKPKQVLRTHTTSVTLRELEQMAKTGETEKRMFNPGKVFRNESTDQFHEAQFYQIDGFAVGPIGSVTLADLKGTFDRLYREYLGPDAQVRFRPSYFPFVEPGVEIDVWYEPAKKWLEMAGAGMLHPEVLTNAGLDPQKVAGFAFGAGLERLLMVKYGIPDVRLFHSGDIRFVYGFDEKPL